jgi:hypothetical protein
VNPIKFYFYKSFICKNSRRFRRCHPFFYCSICSRDMDCGNFQARRHLITDYCLVWIFNFKHRFLFLFLYVLLLCFGFLTFTI